MELARVRLIRTLDDLNKCAESLGYATYTELEQDIAPMLAMDLLGCYEEVDEVAEPQGELRVAGEYKVFQYMGATPVSRVQVYLDPLTVYTDEAGQTYVDHDCLY